MLYCDRAGWMRAISKAIPGTTQTADLAARLEEPAIVITRSQNADEGVTLSGPGCSWSFRMLAKDVIFSRFKGDDKGDLTDAALDEMDRLLGESGQKATWFMDLRDAHSVAASVSQTWTEWLSARQDRLGRVRAYAPSPLFPLVLTIAKYRSGTERVLQVHRDLDAFRNDLIAASSVDAARSLDV
jgi:succinate dehydrogenase flavin-adding protein (antitoxin of CptAB toxin-antitoxin module)